MVIGITIAIFIFTMGALFSLGAAYVVPSSAIGARLSALLNYGLPKRKTAAVQMQELAEPISRLVPKSPGEVSQTRKWLMQAGYRELSHLTVYFAIRGLLCIVALLAIIGLRLLHSPLIVIAGLAFAYMLPRFLLKRIMANRQRTIQFALADSLDLLVICVEAGLGLDQALQRVSDELKHVHPTLSEELQLVHLEIRAGKSRAEALRNLAERTGVNDLRGLVAILVQTDRFGTSIAQALRVHSDSFRTERRQRAEEQAAKTTIKMVPVLVLFVFPSMFFITLGPAFIQVYRNLLPEITR